MRLRESLQGSRDREIGPSQSLSTFPRISQSCNNKKEGGGIGGRGWDGDTIAGARFGVTTVYLVLILTGGGSCAGMVGAAGRDLEANTWEGACDFVSGHGAPRRPRVSLPVSRDQGGAHNRWGGGLVQGQKREGILSFRARRCLNRREAGGGGEGRRRQQMTATPPQLANSSAPGATTTAVVPNRSARRLGSQAPGNRLRGTGIERGELGRKAKRKRGTESHRPPGLGWRDQATGTRRRTDRSLGNAPLPNLQRGIKSENVCDGRRGIRCGDYSQRIRLPHPPVDLAMAVADASRETGDRARVGVRVWLGVRSGGNKTGGGLGKSGAEMEKYKLTRCKWSLGAN
ncbi:uncharacterized protein LOC118147771 [Callithrix jacchus]|uniref:uncharacterized protein LOC118147771 n=1 Tax=Callithrix jacchus TaxID=9483 RepID=UPI00159D50B3|nr:uncharacterized protein LOC118147771 [Callithrix jacchus]